MSGTTRAREIAEQERSRLQQYQGYVQAQNAYPNALQPQQIMVRLSDDDVQRIVTGILDGMQERWGRRPQEGEQ